MHLTILTSLLLVTCIPFSVHAASNSARTQPLTINAQQFPSSAHVDQDGSTSPTGSVKSQFFPPTRSHSPEMHAQPHPSPMKAPRKKHKKPAQKIAAAVDKLDAAAKETIDQQLIVLRNGIGILNQKITNALAKLDAQTLRLEIIFTNLGKLHTDQRNMRAYCLTLNDRIGNIEKTLNISSPHSPLPPLQDLAQYRPLISPRPTQPTHHSASLPPQTHPQSPSVTSCSSSSSRSAAAAAAANPQPRKKEHSLALTPY